MAKKASRPDKFPQIFKTKRPKRPASVEFDEVWLSLKCAPSLSKSETRAASEAVRRHLSVLARGLQIPGVTLTVE